MDQTIQGKLDIESPALATPFNVLTLDAQSFVQALNLTESYFIVARDLGAQLPSGLVRFSVRADGAMNVGTIVSPTITLLEAEISNLQAAIKQLQTQIFDLNLKLEGL